MAIIMILLSQYNIIHYQMESSYRNAAKAITIIYCHLHVQTFSILPYIGTIVSKTYGVAKKATAIAVRVLNAGGSGSFA